MGIILLTKAYEKVKLLKYIEAICGGETVRIYRRGHMHHLSPQLIEDARAGSETAVAAVLAAMMPHLRAEAARVVCPGLEREDALQEGIIGLFSALKTYRPDGSAGFETYACTCIQNAVNGAHRAAGRKKHGPLNNSLPLDEDQPAPGPEELTIRREELEATLEAISTRLSPFEQEVLVLFLEGSSYQQIADRLGRTAKAVENALFRLRRKLKSEQSDPME